jgi:enediyne biosynthesis protein E4
MLSWFTQIALAFLLSWQPQISAEEQLRQAQTLFNQRRFAEAAAIAQQARQQKPELLAAWKLSGLSAQLSERLDEAAQEFSLALQRFPNDADLWFFLARVQYLQSALRPAEQSARRALGLQPKHAGAHIQLGLVLEALNDLSGALPHYQSGVELDQQQPRPPLLPLLQTANLLMKLERFSEALSYLDRAAKLEQRSSEVHLGRGRALEKLGKLPEAEKAYQQAVAIDGHPMARSALERLQAGVTAKPKVITSADALAPVRFRDVAGAAGLNFVLRNDASPRKYQVETMTGGVAVIDFDNDGWPDIYFVNGAKLPEMQKTSLQFWNRLYRNNHDGTFSDVTEKAGAQGAGYAMGAAVADYDNDGDQDVFVAGVNRNQLFRNDGQGRFEDVTEKARLAGVDPHRGKMWSVSAAWLDYDNDGDLDLFVVNYCKWHPELDPYCGAQKEGWRTYCFPDRYEGLPNQLFRNDGGVFTDVSQTSGIAKHIGKGMGVAVVDYDDDGFMDVFVANDTQPNFLFHNNRKGGFEETALLAGVALNDSGKPVSSMGVDFRDYDNDGHPDLLVSALEGETFPLFRNQGKGFFMDATWTSGLGSELVKRSGWGLGIFDFNNDGWKDIFTANAHVNDNQELYNEQAYRQANSLLLNTGTGRFQNAAVQAGEDFQRKRAHRGTAFADFDNDGLVDVVTTALNEPVELFRNEARNGNHWLTIQLIGTRSNRDAIGAQLKLTLGTGATQFNHVTTSVGYASASDRRVYFGLGKEQRVKSLEIRWPSRLVQVLTQVAVDRVLVIKEAPAK